MHKLSHKHKATSHNLTVELFPWRMLSFDLQSKFPWLRDYGHFICGFVLIIFVMLFVSLSIFFCYSMSCCGCWVLCGVNLNWKKNLFGRPDLTGDLKLNCDLILYRLENNHWKPYYCNLTYSFFIYWVHKPNQS